MSAFPGNDSFVQRFIFEELDIRGAVVRLREVWRQMQSRRGYAAGVRRLLGEMTAVTALIGCNLKQPGRLTFQLQGDGPVSLLVIDCTRELGLRGMAQAAGDSDSVPALLGNGRLALTLQPETTARPYQSIVPLHGTTVAAIFEHFLAQSEQQPAHLRLNAADEAACGLFLQKLPGADQRDADGWNRILQLAATLRVEELEQLPPETLLTRLFPEETIRIFTPHVVHYDCPEDWEKVRNMLRSLGRGEVESILREKGEVVVHDDICNREYRFDAQDVEALFQGGGNRTLH
jgi:molecular chaperone Hsp33